MIEIKSKKGVFLLGEYGLRIKNYKAGALYGYNLGVRERYDYTDAMFNKSLFYYHMVEKGGL